MRLSVLVPALNEERALPATLSALADACPEAHEVIVIDGGSADATRVVAQRAGAIVLPSERGRGRQMNAGAGRASGDVLLFLHADTLLPPGAQGAIETAMASSAVAAGNFRLAFDPPGAFNAAFAAVYNARSARARHYYGDSCLFVRRDAFDALGGFREAMLMEDWEFLQRLEARCRARGERTVLLPLTVRTSARRFTGRRRWRYVWLWAYLHYLHARGVSGDELARLYPDTR